MDSAGRRWARRAGLASVLAGLVVLGYLGWQLYGSTWLAQRTHAQVSEDLRFAWVGDLAEVETDHGTAGALLRIPRLGVDYEVPVLEGVEDAQLSAGVGHFPESQRPGEVGNYALAGHRITHGEPFADLARLRVGDEVVVETRDAVHTYVLDTGGDALEVPMTDGWVVAPQPQNPAGGVGPAPGQDRLITLTTCAELFHTDLRWVVFGHLVSSEPRTP